MATEITVKAGSKSVKVETTDLMVSLARHFQQHGYQELSLEVDGEKVLIVTPVRKKLEGIKNWK